MIFEGEDIFCEFDDDQRRREVLDEFAEAQHWASPEARLDEDYREFGDRSAAIKEAHDQGVEQGKSRAEADGLSPVDPETGHEWANPLEDRGGFGQGLDDVMFDGEGHPVALEYKGEESGLSKGQMERDWVEAKIDEIREAGDHQMADRLKAALDRGELTGRLYRTRLDESGNPLAAQLERTWHYPGARG